MGKNLCKMTVSFDVYDELLSLIGVKNADELITLSDEEIAKRLHTIKLSLNNHEGVIKQNQNLQAEVGKLKKYDIRNLPANEVDIDYPAGFKVIAYSFYSFLDSILHVGIVKTVYLSQSGKNFEKIYIGISSGKDLKRDLEHIVLYGQKIYEEIVDA